MITKKHQKQAGQEGFTIIELMIATSVFSIILLLVTIVMISIGNLYYKGVNQARIQDATRTVTDDVSQRLQLSGQSLATASWLDKGEQAYCIGNTRYTYVVGVQLGHTAPPETSPPTPPVYDHILWRDTNPTPGSCSIDPGDSDNVTPVDLTQPTPSPGGTELASADSRLTVFCIGTLDVATGACTTTTISPFPLSVGMAYGDDVLLCSPSVAGSCASGAAMGNLVNYIHGDLLCKTNTNDRFCSTASLDTTVVQRL